MAATTTSAKLARRWRCITLSDANGSGKAPAKCPRCKGQVLQEEGVYGVFAWTGTGRYPVAEALETRTTERAADAARLKLDPAEERLVVRFVSA